jgi:hypothetical protein
LYKEFQELIFYLDQGAQISFRNTAEENFRKALLLAAASYFEHCISDAVLEFANETSNGNELLVEFVKNKAISRQYHTFFDWDSGKVTAHSFCPSKRRNGRDHSLASVIWP